MSETLRIDRVIAGVGRIARYTGTTDEVQFEMYDQAITKLAKKGRLDVLQQFKDGALSPDALFLACHGGTAYELGKLEDQQRRDPETDCSLYAILRRDTSEVKLGIAGNVAKRLRMLQSASAVKLEIIGTTPGGPLAERAIHQRFAHLRLEGEWFRYTDELAEHIADAFLPFAAQSPADSHTVQNAGA